MRVLCLFLLAAGAWGRSYYVDCAAGDDAADGAGPATAWRTTRSVNRMLFRPGDRILLRRGTACTGSLHPLGSGSASAPITLESYGEGPLPRISAGRNAEAALLFRDQQYWTVQNLEFIGGRPHGVYVTGTTGVLRGIRLINLIVHGVRGAPINKEGGLVIVASGNPSQRFDDVLVDGITAYGTTQWAGILVGSVAHGFLPAAARSTNVVVRNSLVHDVAGDGIVLFQVNRGTIESSVAWHTGMQKTQTIGTPNAIWTWMCGQCVVRRCEAFLTDSPGVDGGAFDIDYGDSDNVVQDSYGHDTQGYCVAIFGAGYVTTNSIVRRNLCTANGRSPRLAALQGAVYLTTWNKGKLRGVEISNNRIVWHPPLAAAAVVNTASFLGTGSFENNLIDTPVPQPIRSNPALQFSHNNTAKAADPSPQANRAPGVWRLVGFVRRNRDDRAILAAAWRQFHAAGLSAALVLTSGDAGENLRWDWNLGDIAVLPDTESAPNAATLVSPSGEVVWRCEGPISPGELGLALRRHLGEPDYVQLISEP